MDAPGFLRVRYDEIHRAFAKLLADLPEAELRGRPHPGVNPVTWLLWHSARVEDVAVNRFVTDGAQVLDDGWHARLAVDRRDVGTGMSDAEVDALSAGIDLGALGAYWAAVSGRTREVVDALGAVDLDAPVPAERVRRVSFGERAVAENAAWLAEFWSSGRSHGWVLAQTALLHPYGHYYDARVTAGLWGHRSP